MEFIGEGLGETAKVKPDMGSLAPALKKGDTVLSINPKHCRPNEVPSLLGNARKAANLLGWKTKVDARRICHEMVFDALKRYKKSQKI